VNTEWNFCEKTKEQFETAFEKETINKELKENTGIPLSQLLFDLTNNEIENFDVNFLNFVSDILKPKVNFALGIISMIKNNQLFKGATLEKAQIVLEI
jgi:hypothetical protein